MSCYYSFFLKESPSPQYVLLCLRPPPEPVCRSDPDDRRSERSRSTGRDGPGLQRDGGRNPHGPYLTRHCGLEVFGEIRSHQLDAPVHPVAPVQSE